MNKVIRVVVCGSFGKMGSKIASLVTQDKEMKLVGLIEKSGHPAIGDYKEGVQIRNDLGLVIKEKPPEIQVDVIIDFSNPEATIEHFETAAKYGKPIVIGTTGFTDRQIASIRGLSYTKNIPCVLAPNMSPGANLLFKLGRRAAKALPDYDIEIIEFHHNKKKDAPSGTAYKLAEEASLGYAAANPETAKNRELSHGRHGAIGPRKPEEIGMHAVRAGDIVGDHMLILAGPGERIEIIHRAHSRDVFAHGAIKAAKWIIGQKPGIYDMQDVLSIE